MKFLYLVLNAVMSVVLILILLEELTSNASEISIGLILLWTLPMSLNIFTYWLLLKRKPSSG